MTKAYFLLLLNLRQLLLNHPQCRFSLVVAMSICLSVCVFVPSRLIVNYAQTVRISVFCHIIDCISFALCIQNIKGNLNCSICSKVTTIEMTIKKFFLHTYLFFFTFCYSNLQRLKVNLLNYQKISEGKLMKGPSSDRWLF